MHLREPRSADGQDRSDVPQIVIVGGGFGGLAAARALGSKAVNVLLIDRSNHHLFQPLLYQVALASLGGSDIAVPIRSVVRNNLNIDVVLGEVVKVDLNARQLWLGSGDCVTWTYLILAAGALTNYHGHDDWAMLAPGLKTMDDALQIRRRVLLAFEAAERAQDPGERQRLLSFVVVGGGPTGVELAGAIADLSRDILGSEYRHLRGEHTHVTLLEAGDRVLPPMPAELSESAVRQLRDMGVIVRTDVHVSAIDERGVHLGDEFVAAGTILWGAGVAPNPLGRTLGVATDHSGRVIVTEDCSIPDHRDVFVLGDMASFIPAGAQSPLPAVSPVAIQQGRAVANNILRDIGGKTRRPFKYVDRGFLATIGRAHAVGEIKGVRLRGVTAWLAWALLHLWYLVGFRNRIAVFLNWIWAYVMSKHGARVITGLSRESELTNRPGR